MENIICSMNDVRGDFWGRHAKPAAVIANLRAVNIHINEQGGRPHYGFGYVSLVNES